MREEKRHQMMQDLFGDQSEDEEDEIDSDNDDFHRQPGYQSGEGEGEAEIDGGGEAEVEGQGEVEVESQGEPHEIEPDEGESEGERAERELVIRGLRAWEKKQQKVMNKRNMAKGQQ